MKYPHSVPLWRIKEEFLPGNDILLEQHHLPSSELADLTYKRHVVVINIGHSSTWEFKKEGRFRRFFKPRGAISFFPSQRQRRIRSVAGCAQRHLGRQTKARKESRQLPACAVFILRHGRRRMLLLSFGRVPERVCLLPVRKEQRADRFETSDH
jgi:hypothetical protein